MYMIISNHGIVSPTSKTNGKRTKIFLVSDRSFCILSNASASSGF